MKKKVKTGVLLKGGLGNQLFQIAAGLYSSKGEPLEVFTNFTQPRQTAGQPDALFFKWPHEVAVNERRSNKFDRKALALNLNQALGNKLFAVNDLVVQFVKALTDFIFSLKFRERTYVFSGVGSGFCTIELKPGQNLLNGYFQAHQFPFHPEVFPLMREIRLKQISPALKRLIDKAEIEKPVIIHLRLGDYKNESGIGLLPPKYYEKALRELESRETSKNIWIFTDEVESVEKFITPSSMFSVSIIGQNNLNPAETLELMRHGSTYVIANSTFSWWAAFLSYRTGCTTIMPSPWFQNMPSPVGIKPQDWIEVETLIL